MSLTVSDSASRLSVLQRAVICEGVCIFQFFYFLCTAIVFFSTAILIRLNSSGLWYVLGLFRFMRWFMRNLLSKTFVNHMNYYYNELFICLFIWKWAWPADLHLICASDDELHRLSGCVMTKYKEFSYIGELSGVHLFVQCSLSAHAHFPSPPIDQQPHLKLREAERVFLSGGCRGWTVIADSSGTPNGSSASCYCLCLCVMVFFMCCIQCPDGAQLVCDSFHKPTQTICHTQVLLFCSLTCLISH